MAKSDSKDDLPTFEVVHQDNEANEKCQLNDIDEANSFWINLWEKEGQGNANAEWLQEISSAFARNVPSSSERDCRLDAETVEKALVNKKRKQPKTNYVSEHHVQVVSFLLVAPDCSKH